MVDYRLNVYHTAANEAGLNAFLIFIKDNYVSVIRGAGANSKDLECSAMFMFDNYTDMVNTVVALKGQFEIEYNLQVNI